MARGDLPHIRFFPQAFVKGVRGLKPIEVCVYWLLLCRIFEEDRAPEIDDEVLAAYCGVRPDYFRKAFDRLVRLGKIRVHDGTYSNKRAMEELGVRRKVVARASANGKLSAEKRKQNQGPDAAMDEQARNYKDKIKKERDTSKEVSRKKSEPKTGKRLPAEWALPRDWGVWAMSEEGMTESEVRREADRFRDYWIAVAGA